MKLREFKSQFNAVSFKNKVDPVRGDSYDTRLRERTKIVEHDVYYESLRKL